MEFWTGILTATIALCSHQIGIWINNKKEAERYIIKSLIDDEMIRIKKIEELISVFSSISISELNDILKKNKYNTENIKNIFVSLACYSVYVDEEIKLNILNLFKREINENENVYDKTAKTISDAIESLNNRIKKSQDKIQQLRILLHKKPFKFLETNQ